MKNKLVVVFTVLVALALLIAWAYPHLADPEFRKYFFTALCASFFVVICLISYFYPPRYDLNAELDDDDPEKNWWWW